MERWFEKVLAIISIIVAILVILFGIYGLVGLIRCGFCSWQAIIFICYLIFFGVMVILLEFKASAQMLEWFGFMRNFAGKGLFFIFLGLIAFGVPLWNNYEFIIPGFVIVYGIVLVVIYFAAQKNVRYELIK